MKINRFMAITAAAALYLTAAAWHAAASPAGALGIIFHAQPCMHEHVWLWLLQLTSLAGYSGIWCGGKVLLAVVAQILCYLARVALFIFLFVI
jgi:hypothetical protein